MASLLQHIVNAGNKHVWGLQKEEPVSKIKQGIGGNLYGVSGVYNLNKLKPKTLREISIREPFTYKAILKKNKDTFRNGFLVKAKKPDDKVPKKALKLIDEFNERTFIVHKLEVAGRCSNIYGTGFIERTFQESNGKPDSPVKKGSKPLGLIPLNSEFITEINKHPNKNDGIDYYVYAEDPMKKVYIHPDRIIALSIDKLPHSPFGISKVEVLSKILASKMNADESSGEILSWFSHGILDMTINGMTPQQQKEMIETYKKHPSGWVHDEDYQLQVHNPTQIDPEPFYDYFYNNIAAAFEMPTHILIGQQMGNVTGSEIGLSDYYHDIENIQKMIVTPVLVRIYKQLLESNGMKWDYIIDWNPIFVDELSEAKILQTRSYSAVQNFNSGIIDLSEARYILNEGVTELDIDKKIKKDVPQNPPVSNPNIEPQPTVKKPTIKQTFYWAPLNEEQKKMIEAERERGRLELIEQEKRLKEAEEKRKKKK